MSRLSFRLTVPPLTRSLLLVLVALTTLNTILQPVGPIALSFFTRIGHGSPFLSIVPGQSWRYPWTLLSATFVEQNIWGLLVSILVLYFGGRYLERAWGLGELAKFVVIVSVIPNLLTLITYEIFYGLSRSDRALYEKPFPLALP